MVEFHSSLGTAILQTEEAEDPLLPWTTLITLRDAQQCGVKNVALSFCHFRTSVP